MGSPFELHRVATEERGSVDDDWHRGLESVGPGNQDRELEWLAIRAGQMESSYEDPSPVVNVVLAQGRCIRRSKVERSSKRHLLRQS